MSLEWGMQITAICDECGEERYIEPMEYVGGSLMVGTDYGEDDGWHIGEYEVFCPEHNTEDN